MQQPTDPKRAGWARHAPLVVILTVAVIGYFTLRDYITFDTLRDNREALLAFRDANYAYISDGVKDGESVVTSNLASVVDGADLRTEEGNE